jgi:predicted anti-sigma-YlaC factor YlaD
MTATVDDIACKELVELVSDYLDGELSPIDLKRFEDHLEICVDCREYVEQIRQTIEVSGRVTEQSLEPDMRDQLLSAFRDWKRDRRD